VTYSYLERGSDERQYCSPGVDLPVASIMRTKYGKYPEYHTSLDNLDLITPSGLFGAYDVLKKCIECLENNEIFTVSVMCEPQLGKRGLYPTLGTKSPDTHVRNMMNFLAYCDGKNDLMKIADIIQVPVWDLFPIIDSLKKCGLVKSIDT
jgi:aminopeptidase-like protein